MVELRWSQSLLCLRVLAIVDSVTFAVFAHGTDSAAYHLSNESGGDTRSIQLIMPQIPMIPMVAGVDFPAPDDAKIGANMHKMESLLGGVLRAVEETYGGCGVSATLRADGRWERSDSLTPKCGTVMATNCSFSYAQLQCPEDCPFLVPHEHYACRFQCVLSSQCYTANLDRAFGNEKTHLCDSCDLEGCKWCASQSECHECHDGFHIVTDDDGRRTCAFSLDHGGWWAKILYVLGALIGMILLTSVGYCCCGSQNPNAADNYLSIYQGRRQRHLSKVHKWDLGSLQRPREFYNLAANVHSRDILGVGFALFYNTIAFYFCVWGVMFVVTQWLYSDDRLQVALPKATSDYAVLASESIVVSKAEPLLLVTPMQHCWEHSQTGVEEILHVFAVRKFYAVSILFIFFFAASLYFAFAQKRFARWFDSRSVSMSDFVLAVHGLPAGSTNEVQLKRWFTGECGRLAPQSVVHGVSIGYCYKHIEAEVSDMLSRLSTLAELHLDADVKTEKDDSVTNTKAQHAEIYDKVKQDRERVKTWFESGSAEELRSTGSAFLVFESSKGKEALLAAYAKDPNCLRHPSAPNDPIHLEAVESQPPDIFWENLSVTTSTLKWNIAKAVLKANYDAQEKGARRFPERQHLRRDTVHSIHGLAVHDGWTFCWRPQNDDRGHRLGYCQRAAGRSSLGCQFLNWFRSQGQNGHVHLHTQHRYHGCEHDAQPLRHLVRRLAEHKLECHGRHDQTVQDDRRGIRDGAQHVPHAHAWPVVRQHYNGPGNGKRRSFHAALAGAKDHLRLEGLARFLVGGLEAYFAVGA
eukprot:TRINITY_DN7372_c0_g3_i2.p1 TRINITY_DN7372_c0_g3~~TRINITY_DN7372_c0_g3_i2.p1  ORF type:complete len:807 (+),score=90.03 TRINITY_DN7372_c0_g3_i2:32-2452(+)